MRYRQRAALARTICRTRLPRRAARIAKPLTLAAARDRRRLLRLPADRLSRRVRARLDRRHRHDRRVRHQHHALACAADVSLKPPPEPEAVGYRRLAPVDRFMARYRVPILVLAALAVVAGLPLFRELKFDFNPLNLRSAKVESVATLLDLMKDPETTPNVINVLTPDRSRTAASLAQRLDAASRGFGHRDDRRASCRRTRTRSSLSSAMPQLCSSRRSMSPEVKAQPSDGETRAALNRCGRGFSCRQQERRRDFGRRYREIAESIGGDRCRTPRRHREHAARRLEAAARADQGEPSAGTRVARRPSRRTSRATGLPRTAGAGRGEA